MSNAGSPKFDQLTFEGRVKTIGSPLWAKSTVTNVNILTGHPVSIGGSAFADCTNLKTVRVGVNSAIASVGDNAFSGCSAMERIDWDDHEPGYAFAPVTTFGLNPFNNGGFKNVKQPLVLTNINWTTQNGYRVPDINPNNSSSWCPFKPTGFTDLLFVMKPDTGNTENLPYGFWSRANTGGSYNGLFTGMTGLTNAVIRYPAVSMLSEAIFMDCSALETVTLDATKLEKIGSRAFGKCAKLKRIVTPNVPRYDPSFAVSISTLTTLGNIAFSCCSALTSVSLGSLGSPLLIQGTTDNNPGANNSGTFASCGLERVELMASELNLGTDSTYSWVFYNCKSLKRVDISAVRVVGVGNGTFGSCSALADVYWTSPAPEKVGTGNAIFGSVNTVNHVMRGQWPATPSGVIPCITWTDSKSGTWKVHSSQTVPLAAWTPVAGAGFVILGQ